MNWVVLKTKYSCLPSCLFKNVISLKIIKIVRLIIKNKKYSIIKKKIKF